MLTKHEYGIDDRVIIVQCEELTGLTGTILGKSTENITDTWIVLLDVPLPTHKAVTIPTGCLRPYEG